MAKRTTSQIEMFPCGTPVFPKQMGNITGMITCAANRFGRITYEVTYYIGGDERTVWMHEQQFRTKARKKPIGFK